VQGRIYIGEEQQASWAPKTGQLLLPFLDTIYVINRDGSHSEAHLHMPGHLTPYTGMHNYALSADGQWVAYSLYARDPKDKQPDGFGKLYLDLMLQKTSGSEPVRIATGTDNFVPAWHPNGTAIAYRSSVEHTFVATDVSGHKIESKTVFRRQLNIGDIQGQIIAAIDPRTMTLPLHRPQAEITQIRWDPQGNRLVFLYDGQLFLLNADGSDLHAVDMEGLAKDSKILSVAWSPSGKQFVFRSTFKAGELCKYNFIYKFETGHFPCVQGYHLFTSNTDGSGLKRITTDPEYSWSNLFWIQ
jgi:Tol biopolymer transport system component